MEQKIMDSLLDIGYKGSLVSISGLKTAISNGPKNVDFIDTVHYLTTELRTLCHIDEIVNKPNNPEEDCSSTFIMELSSFLKEMNCPYAKLTQNHISERFRTSNDCLLLLDYLCTELMAVRILQENPCEKSGQNIKLQLRESTEAANLKRILINLKLSKPQPNVDCQTLFGQIQPRLETVVRSVNADVVGAPAVNGQLSDDQWKILESVQNDLYEDYKIRREMLLTRLDVTIDSFKWSDRSAKKTDLITKLYTEKKRDLKPEPNVGLSDLLAARTDIAIIEKTSNSTVRKNTKSQINQVIIGSVPDRGGRTDELAPPPPEMPSWQQRQQGGGASRGRGGYQQQRGSYQNQQFQSNYGSSSKRPKNYESSFQGHRGGTFSEQYVQEDQQNRQYHQGQGRGQRGRGHYKRGRNYY